MCVEGARRNTGFARKHFKPRECDDRDFSSLGQALYSAQPDADAGKASRPVDDDDSAQFSELNPSRLQQFGHRGDQRRRVGPPRELSLPENLDVAPRQAGQRD